MNIAMITGASSGMGREFARQIAAKYPRLDELWLVSRRREPMQVLADQLSVPCRLFALDLELPASLDQIKELLQREAPSIRILVNAAGYGKAGWAEQLDIREQVHMITLNDQALVHLTLLCLPHLCRDSRMINLASAAAFCPQPGFAVYAATKSLVLSFSRSLHAELKGRGISVMAVCPGPVDTAFFDRAGTRISIWKKWTMAKPQKVVQKALRDSAHKRCVSIYGVAMHLSYLLTKCLPTTLVVSFFTLTNGGEH